jgi:glycosyltransferase involved in cell wall biosynthesis
MRILYFADIRFPLERANGIQTMQTCHALAERGHDVRLVVRQDTARPRRDAYSFYGLNATASLHIDRVASLSPAAVRRAWYLAGAARRAILTHADVILTRDLGAAACLLRVPAWARAPLVYESHGFAPVVAGDLRVMLSDGRDTSPVKRRRLERRERRVWRGAAGYVTITRALAEELCERFGRRDRVAVVPDGVRLVEHGPPDGIVTAGKTRNDAGEPRDPDSPGPSAPVVGYAGHLYPWKGVDVLLRALALLPGVRGLIVGGHPLERDLGAMQRLADQLGLGGRVRFTGEVPPSKVASLLAQADVLVLPNSRTHLSARYTSPLKLFEYLAAGKPIVASDLPALREVLADGDNALLSEPGSAESLAAAVGRVIADRELARRLGAAARARVADYTWARRAERLEDLLQAVLENRATPTGNEGAAIS